MCWCVAGVKLQCSICPHVYVISGRMMSIQSVNVWEIGPWWHVLASFRVMMYTSLPWQQSPRCVCVYIITGYIMTWSQDSESGVHLPHFPTNYFTLLVCQLETTYHTPILSCIYNDDSVTVGDDVITYVVVMYITCGCVCCNNMFTVRRRNLHKYSLFNRRVDPYSNAAL